MAKRMRLNVSALLGDEVVGKFLVVVDEDAGVDQLHEKAMAAIRRCNLQATVTEFLNENRATLPDSEILGDVLRDGEQILAIMEGVDQSSQPPGYYVAAALREHAEARELESKAGQHGGERRAHKKARTRCGGKGATGKGTDFAEGGINKEGRRVTGANRIEVDSPYVAAETPFNDDRVPDPDVNDGHVPDPDDLRGPQMTVPHWIGPTPLSALPPGWHMQYDDEFARPFFWHDDDPETSQWEDPRGVMDDAESAGYRVEFMRSAELEHQRELLLDEFLLSAPGITDYEYERAGKARGKGEGKVRDRQERKAAKAELRAMRQTHEKPQKGLKGKIDSAGNIVPIWW